MFVNDDAPPNEEPINAIPTVDDLVEAMGQLTHESLAVALNQPSYLRMPPDPPLHRLARRDGSSVRNEMSGAVTGLVVQADTVSGGIHVHPPEHPRTGAPWQMPSAPSRFVNRLGELETLDELLLGTEPGCTAVLLAGPAGVGKSAAARAWLRSRRERFPDGVLYADLRDRADSVLDAYQVLRAFLAALGVEPDRTPADLDACAALFRSLTARRRLAVLIEGASSTSQVRPLLPAGEHTATLITSTRRLSLLLLDGAHFLTLEPLGETEATALLERFAGAARIAAQPEDAHRIVQLCAGLPLALCAVGAHLTMHPDRDLESITRHLADQHEWLGRLTVEGNPVVYHALDAGYRALTTEVARLYRLLGALPIDAFTAPVAAATAQLTDRDAARQLDALADAHLLYESAAGVYRFYPLTALHARETTEVGESTNTAVDRVIAWYLASAINAAGAVRPYRRARPLAPALPQLRPVGFTDLGAALDWLDAESAHLLAVARYCAQHQRARTGLEIASQMWALWAYRKYYPLWEAFDALGLSCARTLGDQHAEARMLRRLGLLCTHLGRYGEAREYLNDAAGIFERLSDEHRAATALNSLGVVELRDGDPEAAIAPLTRALAIHQERGETRQTALVLIDLADAEIERGHLDLALTHLGEADNRLEDSPDAYTVARARMLRGRAHIRAAAFDEAERELTTALDVMQRVGSPFGQAEALVYLSELAASTDKAHLAAHRRAEAAELLRQLGAPSAGWLSARIAAAPPTRYSIESSGREHATDIGRAVDTFEAS
jgi:tetratricopeptide (TPR) repeat protein